jgi:hypothetical protein
MLESFYQTHDYLVQKVQIPMRRHLMDEINWNDRLIAIKGGRGVGKTDFLLYHAKELLEKDPASARETLYINFNNFYFAQNSLYDLAGEFVKQGGKTLLLDQIFKYPNWSKELRDCFFHYTTLHIVFSASPVMRLVEGNQDIGHIVRMYNLRGYSFREYLELQTQTKLPIFTFKDIILNHEKLAAQVCSKVKPLYYFRDYLEHGYYPGCMDNRFYNEMMLNLMNMMIEVDILLVKQIDVAYLGRIRQLLYLLMLEVPCTLNITKLADATETSRATMMNYIKSLKDGRLINLLYTEGKQFPMKPSRVYMQNPNLCFALPTRKPTDKELAETFFYSALHGIHKINASENATFIIDGKTRMDVFDKTPRKVSFRYSANMDLEIGSEKQIPLWLFGFLY